MLEIIGLVIGLAIVGGLGTFIWYKAKDAVFPRPSIYLFPDEEVYILNQGNVRIVFDKLTLVGGDILTMDDINNSLIIGKYSPVDPTKTYLVLEKDEAFVSVVPIDMREDSGVELHLPNSSKPTWMKITDFQEKQLDILSQSTDKH